MRISGAVALVTGASSGIGRASALRLAAAGAQVLAHGRDAARLAELCAQIDGVPLPLDLAGGAAAGEQLAAHALAAAGRVDILVNNAGLGYAGRFADMAPERIDPLIALNLAAPVALTRALVPGLIERGRGHLAFVTSIAGRMGVAEEAVYAATKGGLDVFAESLRFELGRAVGVSVVVPGVVQTRFFDNRGRPYQRTRPKPVSADAVAGALVRAIATGRAERYVPGWLRLPVAVRGALPGAYRRLGARFGGAG
jgi:short-subunit dehydrogenase